MEQTKLQSKIEAVVNSIIGYIISVIAMYYLLPMFGVSISPTNNMALVAIFTVISILRNYVIRRYFNGLLKKAAATIAEEL